MTEILQKGIVAPLRTLWQQMVDYLPQVSIAVTILIAGVILGWIVKQIVYRGLQLLKFDRLSQRIGLTSMLERVGYYRGSSLAFGNLSGGFVLLLFVLLALNALGPAGSDLVLRFFLYLPHILIALLILVVGGMAAAFFSRGALIAAANAHLPSARLLAGGVRVLIWLLTLVIALEHVGIGRTTLAITFGVIFGGLIAGLAIAFGIAGKDMAREALESLLRRKPKEPEDEGIKHI